MSGYDGNIGIVTDGLVLHLDAANPKSFINGSTTWNDLSGNRNNGTLINGPTFSSANAGSISFDGVNDNVSILNSSLMNLIPTRPASISIWCRFNNVTTRQVIIADWTSIGMNETCHLEINGYQMTPKRIGGYLQNIGGGTQNLEDNIDVLPNIWYNIVIQNTDLTHSELYINGSLRSSRISTQGTPDPNNLTTLGSGGGYQGLYLNGNISDFKIYKGRFLTQSEITQNFNALKSRYNL